MSLNRLRDKPRTHPRSLKHRTAHLSSTSRILYRIEHYSSSSVVAVLIVTIFACLIIVGAILGFPQRWVIGFEVGISMLTLVFVVAIQHTQTREQIATQRKLDELLHSLPNASNELILLEEAGTEVLQDVEDVQREVRDRHANR
jgi:low affinity Fe/Cu permease